MSKLVLVIFFCFSTLSFQAKAKKQIVIGSKMFTESIILSEMIAILLEEKYQFKVIRKLNLGGTQITFDAIVNKEIDLYPEYTGTAYAMILKQQGEQKAEAIEQIVQQKLLSKYQLYWSKSLGFNNTYALAVRDNDARMKNILRVSDLKNKEGEFRFASPHEFMEREDGFKKFVQTYSLSLAQTEVATLSSGLMYSALKNGEVDIIMSYSTDGRIKNFNLRLLEDDFKFFPPYFAAFVIRQELIDKHPEILNALSLLESKISEKDIILLNSYVDKDKRNPYQVAHEFLAQRKIVNKEMKHQESSVDYFFKITKEHVLLSLISLLLALLISVPLGIAMARNKRLANWLFPIINTIQTIPSLALLGFLIPLMGIGFMSALTALFLYSLLPLVRNIYAGITGINPLYTDTARAIGLNDRQILLKVEIPLAMPVIISGVRTATAIIIGTATLAALVGAGGYGDPIFRGIATVNSNLILLGAIPSALMAIIADKLLEGISEKWLISKGLKS